MTTTFHSMILILCEKLEIGNLNKNQGDVGKGKGYEAKVMNYGEAHTTLYSLNQAICTRSSGLCTQQFYVKAWLAILHLKGFSGYFPFKCITSVM